MTQQDYQKNSECKSELHSQHLCYFVSQGFHLSDPEEYNALVEKAEFKCQHCGRVAKCEDSLCKPAKL